MAVKTKNQEKKPARNNGLLRLLSSGYTVPAIVFLSYLVLNLRINGPAYLSDEVGYLAKAATIAGSPVHMTSSWYGGYPFMISPAFLLSSNPYTEWHIVLAMNALMWAGSAALLGYILRHTHPGSSRRTINLVVLGAMLYPSWLSMSGYAFSTSGFVLVLMATLAAIIKSDLTRPRWVFLAALLAGYLCWIHPFGFIFLGLFAGALAVRSLLERTWACALAALLGVVFALAYMVFVSPWFNHAMSGSAGNDSHYTGVVSGAFKSMLTAHYWVQAGEVMVGLLLFVTVASFGMAGYGAYAIVRKLSDKGSYKHVFLNAPDLVMLLSFLSLAAMLCVTALLWGSTKQLRLDQWVYGRYADMYLLPVIAFGLLSVWRSALAFGMTAYAGLAGIFLSLVTSPGNTDFSYDNKVNIQAFWPMHLTSVFHANYYWLWGLLGACGVAGTWLVIGNRRRQRLALLLIPIMLADLGNYFYHKTILKQHSTVSSLYTYVRNGYSRDDCIGFTTASDSNERFNLYSYYLHGYDVKKVTWPQWQKEKCHGLYLTYDASVATRPSVRLVGREASTGLYVLAPEGHEPASQPAAQIIFR